MNRNHWICALAAGLMATANASAQSVLTDTFSYSLPTSTGTDSQNFSVGPWNTALGTLDSVTFTITGSQTVYSEVINTGATAGSFSAASTSGSFSLFGAGLASPLSETLSASFANTGTPYTIAAGAPITFLNSTPTSNAAALSATASSLASFSSASTYTVGFGPFTSSITNPSASVGGGASANASGVIDVVFTYTAAAVPEPSTVLLLLAGLGCVAVCKRRLRQPI